jgi:hypothetical protein
MMACMAARSWWLNSGTVCAREVGSAADSTAAEATQPSDQFPDCAHALIA